MKQNKNKRQEHVNALAQTNPDNLYLHERSESVGGPLGTGYLSLVLKAEPLQECCLTGALSQTPCVLDSPAATKREEFGNYGPVANFQTICKSLPAAQGGEYTEIQSGADNLYTLTQEGRAAVNAAKKVVDEIKIRAHEVYISRENKNATKDYENFVQNLTEFQADNLKKRTSTVVEHRGTWCQKWVVRSMEEVEERRDQFKGPGVEWEIRHRK